MKKKQKNFIDSNVWIYALTLQEDERKTEQAKALVSSEEEIMISTQVINEVCVTLLKKAGFTEKEVRELADGFFAKYRVVLINQEIIRQGSMLREKHQLSYWDSLIVARAKSSGATHLYSEDMKDGLVIETLTITNPFLT